MDFFTKWRTPILVGAATAVGVGVYLSLSRRNRDETDSSSPAPSDALTEEKQGGVDTTEYFDVLDPVTGQPTGEKKARHLVHKDGDWHGSVHIW